MKEVRPVFIQCIWGKETFANLSILLTLACIFFWGGGSHFSFLNLSMMGLGTVNGRLTPEFCTKKVNEIEGQREFQKGYYM